MHLKSQQAVPWEWRLNVREHLIWYRRPNFQMCAFYRQVLRDTIVRNLDIIILFETTGASENRGECTLRSEIFVRYRAPERRRPDPKNGAILCSQFWGQVCIQTKYYALEITVSCALRVMIKCAWARNFGAACKNFKFWPVWLWKFWDLRFNFPFFVVASLFTTLAPDLQFSSDYCF